MTIRTLAAIAAALVATGASATTLSGTFKNDNDKARIVFFAGKNAVTLTSTGFAQGGFDPVFSLYKSGGQSVAFNDDQAAGNSDSQLALTLAPGYYALYVTQYNNFGPIDLNLADFPFDDVPDFRGGFVDSNGDQRTGFWSVDVTGAAAVPEAGGVMLLGMGVLGFAALRRKTA